MYSYLTINCCNTINTDAALNKKSFIDCQRVHVLLLHINHFESSWTRQAADEIKTTFEQKLKISEVRKSWFCLLVWRKDIF